MTTSARLALPAAAAAVLLAGCGGGDGSTGSTTTTQAQRARLVPATLAPPMGCFVTVFLSESSTTAQMRHVRFLLLANPRVVEVSFVPRKVSFRRFQATRPALASKVSVKQFLDVFEVVPGTRLDVFSIIGDFAAGVDGVANARPSPACTKR